MTVDHFYTLHKATPASYTDEGVACVVFGEDQPGFHTVPVYRHYNSNTGDHYYTTDKGQSNLAISQGYAIENDGNPEFYLFDRPLGCDTVPFHQWLNGTDHFYTTHPTGELASLIGGCYQGILGYVFPANAPVAGSCKPLYRYYKPE